MNSWKKITENLMNDFMAWGCRFNRKELPEIALTYDCTPLFFWNWLDGDTDQSEKGFLRVIGYAFRMFLEEEAEPLPRHACASSEKPAEADPEQTAA